MMTAAIFWDEAALTEGQVGLHGGPSPTAAPCGGGKKEKSTRTLRPRTFSSVSLSEKWSPHFLELM